MKVGDRVKYVGKTSGAGYPYRSEVGKVTATAGTMLQVTLRDGQSVNLPSDQFKPAPIVIPIVGYSILALIAIGVTWKTFR